jgi:tRNA(Arg) A34 adenosine deaminase TadA
LLAINAAGFRIPGREGGILSVSQNECCSAKRDVRVFLPWRFDGAFERLQILEHTIVPRSLTISTKRISQAFFVIVVDFVFVVTGCQPVQPRQPKCLLVLGRDTDYKQTMTDAGLREHEHVMRRCIELARRALSTRDTPVGALLLRNTDVVAEGVESVKARGDVTAHPEIEAIRAACARMGSLDLTGCTLDTSVEPCPMCAYAIRLAGVGMVVTGARSSGIELRGADGLSSRARIPCQADRRPQ